MTKLGVLFDIDALGGGVYGSSAYRIFFRYLNRKALRDTQFYDGDTWATLNEGARIYCIAIESPGEAVVADIEKRLGMATDLGLCPPKSRFLRGNALDDQPLIFAGRVDKIGRLIQCDTPWIINAWQETPSSPQEVVVAANRPVISTLKKWLALYPSSVGGSGGGTSGDLRARSSPHTTSMQDPVATYVDSVFNFVLINKPESRDFQKIEGLRDVPALFRGQGGRNDISRAEVLVRSAIHKFPDYSFAHSWLATILEEKGDVCGARSVFIAAIRVCNEKSYLCGLLGQLESEHGALRDAIKWWIRSVIIQTQSRLVRDHESFLYLDLLARVYNLDDLSKGLIVKYKDNLHGEHVQGLSGQAQTRVIKKVEAEHSLEILGALNELARRLPGLSRR